MTAADLGTTDHRVITSLEARIEAISRDATGFAKQLPLRENELAEAESNLGQSFKHAHLLTLTREQLTDVDQKIAARNDDSEPGPEPTHDLRPAPCASQSTPRGKRFSPLRAVPSRVVS